MGIANRRIDPRVRFEHGIEACIAGIDGSWRRDCIMHDVSASGAKLTVEGSLEGLAIKEFLLFLTRTGSVYRRCESAWVDGDQIGARFANMKRTSKPKSGLRSARGSNPEQ
jgi:hypothetical protein